MVTHAQKFGFFTDVEMVSQILLIGGFVQTVDQLLKKFAGSVGCHFVTDRDAGAAKQLSAMIRGVEHKGEVLQPEGFLVVVAVHQVILLALLHGQDHYVIGDESEKDLAAGLADPLRLFDAAQLVGFLMQMI